LVKDVLITLKSIQRVDKDGSETELITSGTIEPTEDGGICICYEESAVTGFEGAQTVLVCYGDRMVSMKRTGAEMHSSDFVIEKNKKHHCHYSTPHGSFVMGIYTHKIESTLTDSGGDLYLKYTIDINSSYVSDNEVFLNVK